ncbi:MAG TPA: thermonuclease family protein [Chitinophagaceae bacterium]
MHHLLSITCAFILFIGTHCSPSGAEVVSSEVLTGKVVSIADGDTFTMLDANNKQRKIRLHGIDAPEKRQPFGTVSKKRLSELVFGKEVRVEKRATDRYKRIVAIVYADTLNINETMIAEGMAWHFTRYDQNPAWTALETRARSNKSGLWKDAHPLAPWEWRRK